MGDKAGILPTEDGMLTPVNDIRLDGECIMMVGLEAGAAAEDALAAEHNLSAVAGLLGEICHCPGGGGVPQLELELVRRR